MAHNLQQLNGIKPQTIAALEAVGIHSLAQIAALTPKDLERVKGIKTSASKLHAQAVAYTENRHVQVAPVQAVCLRDAWYFDIETVPFGVDGGQVWSIGWSKGDQRTQAAVVAPHRDGDTQTLPNGHQVIFVESYTAAWEVFEAATGGDDEPLFHWSGYDASNMKQYMPTLHTRLKTRLHDLCKLFAGTVQLPRKGVSLKTVAPYLGFNWHLHDDWQQAWHDYLAWRHTDHPEKLIALSHYQADDVLAMIVIRNWLVRLHDEAR